MKTKSFTLFMAIIAIFVINTKTMAQASGDYVATTSGDYNTAANWSLADGMGGYSGVASAAPLSTNNVWIPSGITMTSAAAANAKNLDVAGTFTTGNFALTVTANLTVQAGGVLTTVNTYGGTVNNLVIGATLSAGPCVIQVDGQLGSVDGKTGSGSGFRVYLDAGGTTTFQGSGKVNIARLASNANNGRTQNIVIDMDMNILNTANNGMTLSLQNGNAVTATKTLTINAGRTVNFSSNNAYSLLGGQATVTTNSWTGGDITYDIEGTLNTGTGGGLWFMTTSSTTNTASQNEKITLKVGSTGKLILGPKILTGVAQPTTQSIVYDFQPGSIVEYAGATSTNFLASTISGATQSYMNSFSSLIMSTAGSVPLPANTTITGTLTLTQGKLLLGTNNLVIASGGSILNGSASAYIVPTGTGVLSQTILASTAITFPVGLISSYNPVKINPSNASVFSVKVDSLFSGTLLDATKANPVQWDITSSAATSASLTFTPASATNVTDPVIGRYANSAWIGLPASIDGTSFTASFNNFTSFANGSKGAFSATDAVNSPSSKMNVYASDRKLVAEGLNIGDVLNVYNVNGQNIATVSVVDTKASVSLNKGIYLAKVQSGNRLNTFKIIIQ